MSKEKDAHAANMGAKKKDKDPQTRVSNSKYNRDSLEHQPRSLVDSALAYASLGWKVIPVHYPTSSGCSCGRPNCQSIGKHPITKHGFKDGTTDEKTIRDWWKPRPKANIGIVTGKDSELIVIDIDPRHAGEESLQKLERKNGKRPETVTARTGGGGKHFLFAAPNDGALTRIRAELGEAYPGIDVKGDGGYIVAPPSLHASGKHYEWEKGKSPAEIKPAAMPPWLIEPLTTSKTKNLLDLTDDSGVIRRIRSGERNNTLFKAASYLVTLGYEVKAIGSIIAAIYDKNCDHDPPLANRELLNLAESAWDHKGHPAQRRVPRDVRDLVDEVLFSLEGVGPLDTQLRNQILNILDGYGPWKKVPVRKKRESAARLLRSWLKSHGNFLSSHEGKLFYFLKDAKFLHDLESARWRAWFHRLTGVNPKDTSFAYLQAECETLALHGKKKAIYRVAYFDQAENVLYLSRFDGVVYRLDGKSIVEESNGEHVLFQDSPVWMPYRIDATSTQPHFSSFASEFPHWQESDELCGLAFRTWILSTFFSEIIPARPVLVLLGEQGSGKSSSFRILFEIPLWRRR